MYGDIGLLQVDYSQLQGDEPLCTVTEITKGFADIVPGAYTYEVQTVSTIALSQISGTFQLTKGGYTTGNIPVDADAVAFKTALESIATIYTVHVTREQTNTALGLYAWTVTFAHMKHEVVQGAGDIPPFTVTSQLLPVTTAQVNVFEKIKGTNPLQLSVGGLQTGVSYFARLFSYNDRGYSLTAATASAVPLGGPISPPVVLSGVASGTSINVTWSYPTNVAYNVDSWMVESYTAPPVNEVQVITTSSSASLSEVQRITVDSDAQNLAGYFKLQFNGETTGNIAWNAQDEGDGSVSAVGSTTTMKK
jgi:hypothetical protein